MKKYLQAVGIWIMIIPVSILNGGLRDNVLNEFGDIALPLSGIILGLCIFVIAYFLIPKIKDCGKKEYIIFGVIWFVLTNFFDMLMYLSEGGGLGDLVKSYNFLTGNLWVVVVLTTLFAPMAVAKIKKMQKQN